VARTQSGEEEALLRPNAACINESSVSHDSETETYLHAERQASEKTAHETMVALVRNPRVGNSILYFYGGILFGPKNSRRWFVGIYVHAFATRWFLLGISDVEVLRSKTPARHRLNMQRGSFLAGSSIGLTSPISPLQIDRVPAPI
jgi:hypothetical protein